MGRRDGLRVHGAKLCVRHVTVCELRVRQKWLECERKGHMRRQARNPRVASVSKKSARFENSRMRPNGMIERRRGIAFFRRSLN